MALALVAGVWLAGCGGPGASSDTDPSTPRPVGSMPAMPTSGLLGPFPVARVVDGDTIRVLTSEGEIPVRLIGIDAPESVAPNRPVECFGPEASAETARLLEGGTVLLEPDPTQDAVDRYDRVLAYVWRDGRLINLDLVAAGYAYEYTYDQPYRYQREFQNAERLARQTQEGLWSVSACGG